MEDWKERSFVIVREWSVGAADWEYVLQEHRKDQNEIEFSLHKTWRGDREWARRNAKHFNIPMPSEKEDK